MRNVKVINTGNAMGKQTYQSDAKTLGELRAQLGNSANMQIVVGETNQELTSNDALLPEGEFTLFMTPTKVRSGK